MDKLNIRWLRRQNVKQQQEKEQKTRKSIFAGCAYRMLTLCAVLTSMLCASAFAADGDPTVSSLLSDATPTVTTAMSSVWTLMTSNPISTFALGCAILTVGFRFIRKAIRVSHKA